MRLDELADWEDRLMHAMPDGGYITIPHGVGKQWCQVVEAYASLCDDPVQGMEALRRALFLVWYPLNEPPFLTGMDGELQDGVELAILQRVDQQLSSSEPDTVLRSMLRGYGPGLPFDQYPQLVALNTFLANIQDRCSPDAPLGPLEGRGAMGAYWRSRQDVPL